MYGIKFVKNHSHCASQANAPCGSLAKSVSHFCTQVLQASNAALEICWQTPSFTPQLANRRHLSPKRYSMVQISAGFGPHLISNPWQFSRPQTTPSTFAPPPSDGSPQTPLRKNPHSSHWRPSAKTHIPYCPPSPSRISGLPP